MEPPDEATADALARLAASELAPAMALARLLVAHEDVATLRDALDRAGHPDASHAASARELADLLATNLAGVERAAAMLASPLDEPDPADTPEAAVARCARLFDWAVRLDPEASVALYSLGDPALLAEATAEATALMERLGVAAPGRHLLDLGCGVGRFALALAPKVASVTGIDVSPEMVRVATERCAAHPNVRLLHTAGRDLATFADAAFDAAIAVDSFPYLYRAGGPALAESVLAELARALRPGGDALALNLSYRGDPALDRADAAAFAGRLGLELPRNGTSDLRSWDGATFHFRKAG